MKLPPVQFLIDTHQMTPHPEGGFFVETYRAREKISEKALPDRFTGGRAFSTAILFLLPIGAVSKLHRLQSDEVWHFHLGEPLEIVEVDEQGQWQVTLLGPDILAGQRLQQ